MNMCFCCFILELMLRNDGLLYPDIDSSDKISSGYVYDFNRLKAIQGTRKV